MRKYLVERFHEGWHTRWVTEGPFETIEEARRWGRRWGGSRWRILRSKLAVVESYEVRSLSGSASTGDPNEGSRGIGDS